MKVEDRIKKIISETLNISIEEVHLDYPTNSRFGDLTSNSAMVVGKKENIDPMKLAGQIVKNINLAKDEYIVEATRIVPGFVNIVLNKDYFDNELNEILSNDKYGENDHVKGYKIAIEYTDPNPFKEFHIGHLVPSSVGEAISRLSEMCGAEVSRMNYQGDKGLHVAMAVYGMIHEGGNMENTKDLGRAYAYGAKANAEDENAKVEIQKINKVIYEESDNAIMSHYRKGREISLQYFEGLYEKLGTKFNEYFFESETGPVGAGLVREFMRTGVFEESEGAIIYRGENHGLHNRVFINKEGLPTYEAKELGLAKVKYERFPYDMSLVITANEVKEYFRVLISAMNQVLPELAKKTKHIGHGVLRLPTGKMSSRSGNVISALSLIEEVKEKIKSFEKEEQDEKTREMIAIASIKYSILKYAPGKDMIFDIEKSVSLEGDSGPYLQYSAVRANKIIKDAKEKGLEAKIGKSQWIRQVESLLVRFPSVVYTSAKDSAPQKLVTYLIELASAFNNFYANEKIFDDSEESPHRLAIVFAFHKIMSKGLWILGIRIPDKM